MLTFLSLLLVSMPRSLPHAGMLCKPVQSGNAAPRILCAVPTLPALPQPPSAMGVFCLVVLADGFDVWKGDPRHSAVFWFWAVGPRNHDRWRLLTASRDFFISRVCDPSAHHVVVHSDLRAALASTTPARYHDCVTEERARERRVARRRPMGVPWTGASLTGSGSIARPA